MVSASFHCSSPSKFCYYFICLFVYFAESQQHPSTFISLYGACWDSAQCGLLERVRRGPEMANGEAFSPGLVTSRSLVLRGIVSHFHYPHNSSCRESFVCSRREEHSSSNYLYFLPFLSTNKTNHAQTLLLYHQGEGGVSDRSLSFCPRVCLQVETMTQRLNWCTAFSGSISKQRQPPVY